jgi:uncharacterized membrane protein
MTSLLTHLRKYMARGVIAIIPAALAAGLLYLVYDLIDKQLARLVAATLGIEFPGLGILLLLIMLYAVGLLASSFGGRLLFNLVDATSQRIPLIGRAYQVGKQLSSTLALPEKDMFRRAVLVRYLNTGTWTIGFVTGSLQDPGRDGTRHLILFVPTPPNPFSGTMIIAPEAETRDPGWSIDEALQAVLSGGLLAPATLR